MLHDKKILVLADEETQQHDLVTVLEFIGEHALAMAKEEWKNKDHTSEYIASVGMIVIMGGMDSTQLLAMLEQIINRYGPTPVALYGDYQPLGIDTDPAKRHMIIAILSPSVHFNELNDAIHRAQRYNEAHKIHQDTNGQRPVHLFRSLVGTSREIQAVREMMGQVSDKDVSVLIEGESGTGKEVVARNLHYNSPRREGPFVPVNCGAIPAELLESELFGHEKGAFTGAINARAGRFELAEGGTLFLDEIGDMPLHMQVKILRVLQEKSFERVGGNKSILTNVRIVAATHRNLEKMIEEGRFREDLYYRLNVFPIEMPSLRDRSEDIPLLMSELVSRMESEKRGSIRFNSAAVMSLCLHPWPGNVRELANLVERMAIMQPYGVVGVQDLPIKYRHIEVEDEEALDIPVEPEKKTSVIKEGDIVFLPENGIDLKEYITNLEQSLIQQALDNTGGVVARAAEQLTIRRTTLVEKMRKYGMQR